MKKIKKVLLLLLVLLALNTVIPENMASAETVEADGVPEGIVSFDSPQTFTIEGDNILIGSGDSPSKMRGLLMKNVTVTSTERIETFANVNSLPHIASAIKYISNDADYGDSRGPDGSIRRRYVYCVEHEKSTPIDQILSPEGYMNPYVFHVIYHGAMYYGETCRYAAHSTGNWRYDYLATQMAIVVVTDQYSLEEVVASIRNSPASAADENLLINAITSMVNSARSATAHPGFDSDGWFRMDYKEYTSFTLSLPSAAWKRGTDGYYYSDWITPILTSKNGYYANEDISLLTNTVTTGVSIEKRYSDSLHSPYRLKISTSQYEAWQKTGMKVTSDVAIRVPSHWKVARFSPSGGSSYQDVCFPVYANVQQYATYEASVSLDIPKVNGNIQLKKASTNPELTSENSCYELAGARYTVYQDEKLQNAAGALVTDENGKSRVLTLPLGTYYIKETVAPKGFVLDDTVYKVTLDAGNTSDTLMLEVKDEPFMTPVDILLKKVDADTNKGNGQKSLTLAGAEFTVKYYDVQECEADPAESGKTPVRTWVFRTDEKGIIRLDSSCLVSGDEFYLDSDGAPCLPAGTITIRETKAPEGYHLNKDVFLIPVTYDQPKGTVNSYAVPVIPENAVELHLTKIEDGTGKVLAGAVFEHTKPDGTKETVATDKNGKLSFTGLNWGAHIVREISAPEGYVVNENEIRFSINRDNTIDIQSEAVETDKDGNISIGINKEGNLDAVVENKPAPYTLQLTKKNDKEQVLSGAEFTLYSDSGCTDSLGKKVTGTDGMLTIEKLTVGRTYYLKETKAPKGYKLPEPVIVYEIYAESSPASGEFHVYVNDEMYTADDTDTSEEVYLSGSIADRIVNMMVMNHAGMLLPNTGSNMTVALIILGTAFMLGVLAANTLFEKKKKSE